MLTPEELLRRPLVFSHPAVEQVQVQPDIVYKTIGSTRLMVDVYLPPAASRPRRTPAVIFIGGDAPEEVTLHQLKQSAQYTGWGRLVAAKGMIGLVTNHRSIHQPPHWYVNLPAVATDISDLLAFVQDQGDIYGIDVDRLAIWTASGGPAYALYPTLKQRPSYIRCLIAYYGLLDLRHLLTVEDPPDMVELITEYSPAVQIQHQVETVPPFLVTRAGRDQLRVNRGLDSFVTEALHSNLTLNLLNHPTGQHGFDILDADRRSEEIIQGTITFLQQHLEVEHDHT